MAQARVEVTRDACNLFLVNAGGAHHDESGIFEGHCNGVAECVFHGVNEAVGMEGDQHVAAQVVARVLAWAKRHACRGIH